MSNLEKTSAKIRELVPRLMEGTLIQKKSCEIIGHPIQLADVLEAISYVHLPIKYKTLEIYISQGFINATNYLGQSFVWDCSKTYEDQSPGVHDFLANIIL